MISAAYKTQNEILHETNEAYGCSGHKFTKIVESLCVKYNTIDVLDYGCGKATLEASSPNLVVRNYDPCVPEFAKSPSPADVVVCTDVMEHIEPEYVDDVLDDIRRLTLKTSLITIANRPAKKTLPDGRNAHLIQENYKWWLPKIWSRFHINQFDNLSDKEYILVLS